LIKKIRADIDLKELLKGGAIALFFKVLGVIAGYFFIWGLARFYGAEGVGIFQTLWTLLMIFSVISKLGFDTSIVKFIGNYNETGKQGLISGLFYKIQRWLIISSTILGSLLALFSIPISELLFENKSTSSFIVFTAIALVPLVLVNFHAESLKALKKILSYSLFQNGTIYILTFTLILSFYYLGYGLINTIWSLGIVLTVLAFISFFEIKRRLPQKDLTNYNQGHSNNQLIKWTLPMLLSNSLFLIMNWTDTIMLSAFLPESEVGIYATALKIAALNSIILVAINSIAMPKFAELYEKKDSIRFERFVKKSTFLMFVVSFPILIIILIFPSFLLGIFGKEFINGREALLILATGQFFSTISGSVINILNMSNRQKIAQNIVAISTFINICLNLILIPHYGIIGAAIATATSTILWNLISAIWIYKLFGFLTYPFLNFRKGV
jgi:O-antigen/teichoic acid export membrane protein